MTDERGVVHAMPPGQRRFNITFYEVFNEFEHSFRCGPSRANCCGLLLRAAAADCCCGLLLLLLLLLRTAAAGCCCSVCRPLCPLCRAGLPRTSTAEYIAIYDKLVAAVRRHADPQHSIRWMGVGGNVRKSNTCLSLC